MEREERLPHGCVHGVHRVVEALPEQLAEVGREVKGQAVKTARQGDGAHAQHNHDHEQRAHHHLRHALHALLHAHAADEHTEKHDEGHIYEHLARAGQEVVENLAALGRGHARQLARGALHHEGEHPPGHRGVEHHEQVVACKPNPLDAMPFGARRLKHIVAACDALLAGAPRGKLHHEDWQAENGKKHQVQQDERAAAVLARDIGEAPDVAQADGTARAYQDEAQARGEFLALGGSRAFLHGRSPSAVSPMCGQLLIRRPLTGAWGRFHTSAQHTSLLSDIAAE